MSHLSDKKISVIIPAKNEAESLRILLPEIRSQLPAAEIIVVNDGSTDNTSSVAQITADKVVEHAHSLGNGAAIKAGARISSRPILVFMDGDGQHNPADIPILLEEFSDNHTMVVGARNSATHASLMRRIANGVYNRLATYMTGQNIQDLTSGFRVVNADIFKSFLYMLPNGFSYPTTITMALSRTGIIIKYIPINARKRAGKSHINPLKDGIKFVLIIFKISALYSPLKVFAPASFICFSLGLSYYIYTYLADGRFTNMGVLLFTTALLIFLIGLVSEQIATLMYASHQKK